jgi:hypothetical protein
MFDSGRLGIAVLLLLAGGCDGPRAQDGEPWPDAAADTRDAPEDLQDTADAEDSSDLAADAPEDLPPDVSEDATDAGMDVPSTAGLEAPLELALAAARVTGGEPAGDCVQLRTGGTLTWEAPPVAGLRAAGLDLEASSWRPGARLARLGQTPVRLHHLWGLVRRVAATDTSPSSDAGYGVDYRPQRALVEVSPEQPLSFTVTADTLVCVVHLVPPATPIPEPLGPPERGLLPETTLEVAPCGDACDDGQAITQAIAQSEGPTTIALSAGTYVLRTPIRIRRSDVALVGAGAQRTTLVYDPEVANNWGAAIEVTGPNPDAAHPVTIDLDAHSHVLRTDDVEPFLGARFAYVTAQDYGEVPDLCLGGRDVERQFRHHHFLSRIVGAEDGDIELSRSLPYALPAEAAPTVAPARLLEGVSIADVRVEGACPEAAEIPEHTQRAADCANPHIVGVSAIRLRWAYQAEVRDVEARYLGRFGVDTTLTLEARVIGGGLTLPADYGSGGAGYGVHAIRASRTLVYGYTVQQARHAVVADFGSTETQVIAGNFTACTLAAIDIHGEASYDTLALGNEVRRSNGSVIVGGGGREVHCNDGPGHQFIGNLMESGGIINVQVTDYTSDVTFHHNTITDSGYSAAISAGSSDILFERNAMLRSRAGHLLATDAIHGTDRITLRDNLLDGDPSTWATVEEGIAVTVETPN